MTLINKYFFFLKKKKKLSKIFFSFKFISFFPIYNKIFQINKYFFKNIYLLLLWLYYIDFFFFRKKKLNFFILPLKFKTYSLIKTPMAQKKWSHEQYFFQSFTILINFYGSISNSVYLISWQNFVLLFFIFKQFFPKFETNLFFLKNYFFFIFFYDHYYFKLK